MVSALEAFADLGERVTQAAASTERVLGSMVGMPSRYRPPGSSDETSLVAPGALL